MALSMSKRALRMERRHQKAGPAHLNIVSLMDIFTLLVFFLLASNDTEVLPSTSIVKIPIGLEQKPRERSSSWSRTTTSSCAASRW